MDKPIFKQRKGFGNEAFPKWNPQSEFTSEEENNRFQGIFTDGTRLFIPLFSLIGILISTKGVTFSDAHFYAKISLETYITPSFNTLGIADFIAISPSTT